MSQEKWVLCLEIMGWGSDEKRQSYYLSDGRVGELKLGYLRDNQPGTVKSNTFFNVHNLPHARQVPDLMNPSTSPPLRILRRKSMSTMGGRHRGGSSGGKPLDVFEGSVAIMKRKNLCTSLRPK